MLVKLIKYELIDYFKKTIIFFIITFGMSLMVLGLNLLENNFSFIKYFSPTIYFGYIISIILMFFYCLSYPISRYYKSMLKDEAYLTHTLPVKAKELILAKLFAAIILFLIALMIAFASLLLTKTIDWSMIKSLFLFVNKRLWLAIVLILFFILVYYLAIYMMIITSLTVGHSKSTQKKGFSFLVGIIIYGIQQFSGVISLLIILIFDRDFFNKLNNGSFKLTFLLVPTIISLFLIISEILVTHFFVKNKLNLE